MFTKDYLGVYNWREMFSIKICWIMFSRNIFPIQSSHSGQKRKSFKRQSILERITDFTEGFSILIHIERVFSPWKSASTQTQMLFFPSGACLLNAILCLSTISKCQPPFVKGTNATCKALLLHLKKSHFQYRL